MLARCVRWWVRENPPVAVLRLVRSFFMAVGNAILIPFSIWIFVWLIAPPLTLVSLALMGPWLTLLRANANLQREVTSRDTGNAVEAFYKPVSPTQHPLAAITRLKDSVVFRDMSWVWINGLAGLVMLAIPMNILGWSAVGVIGGLFFGGGLAAFFWGVLGLGLGVWATPFFLRVHNEMARSALTGGQAARLRRRLQDMKASRDDASSLQAAEIQRIERDLHDGAQARLVATGMTLSTAEALLKTDPDAAAKIIAEAKLSTQQALADMRNVVRGIYPPVLADRGLVEALRSMAASTPITTTVRSNFEAPLAAPLESALYFATQEAVTNAVKHSGANRITVTLNADEGDGSLMITVFDNGHGGADESRGSGLQGVRRRMRTFDGRLAVDSPEFGPTVVAITAPLAYDREARPARF